MEIIKPKMLKNGDTIGILAVSGSIKDIEKINNAKIFLEQEGYKVVISDTCYKSHRYMAGDSDNDCIKELHKFFEDKSIDAILCARGGYGTIRLINKINWDIIKNNPKIFAGYSDISVLLAMMYKKCGLITFHSPMANGDFGGEINEYTKDKFFKTLQGKTKNIQAEYSNVYYEGIAHGILWGGNLSSIVSLAGTDFVPNEDIILFVEDLNEPVYKIDKMLTQLLNIPELKNHIKGIAIGDFTNIEGSNSIKSIFEEIAQDLRIPMADEFKITHGKTKDTVPYGIKGTLDANAGKILIQEDYVIC